MKRFRAALAALKLIDNDVLLILCVISTITYVQLSGPYWQADTSEDHCEIVYDGWRWNMEAVYSKFQNGTYYDRLNLSGPFLPNDFGSSNFGWPEEVSVSGERFWLTTDEDIVLAIDENDEWGFHNNAANTLKFLKYLSYSGTIEVSYRDYDRGMRKIGYIEFSYDELRTEMDKFLKCADRI
jgi:hypothetical protein